MILKTGACFTAELELNCPTIVGCVTALPLGPAAVAGTTQLLGKDGQYHTLPASTADTDAQTLSLVGSNLSISNGNTVTLPAAAAVTFATPAQAQAGTSTTLHINPADLYARENIAAQTGVSNDLSAIPAPTASQSPWATNALGERLHYMPNVGWLMVNNGHVIELPITPGAIGTVPYTASSAVMPRAGVVDIVTAMVVTYDTPQGGTPNEVQHTVLINGAPVQHTYSSTSGRTSTTNCNGQNFPVVAGDVVSIVINRSPDYPGTGSASTAEFFYRQNQIRYIA
jgi:hypothetical protein